MESSVVQAFLVAVVVLGYGTAVSWLQERFGKFQDLDAGVKQLVNAVLALILPGALVAVNPYWRPEFGDANQVLTSLAYLAVPLIIWIISQVAHRFDPHRAKDAHLTIDDVITVLERTLKPVAPPEAVALGAEKAQS